MLPLVEKGVDNIVLGCTHYPFLTSIIKQIVPGNVKIIDSGLAVAKQTKKVLEEKNLLNSEIRTNSNLFYTNDDVDVISDFLEDMKLLSYSVTFRDF